MLHRLIRALQAYLARRPHQVALEAHLAQDTGLPVARIPIVLKPASHARHRTAPRP